MQDLRFVLVIVGALAIAALIIHGLWTNQRNKRAQLKDSPKKTSTRKDAGRDREGFDEDGVGPVRVVAKKASPVRDADPVISEVPSFSAAEESQSPTVAVYKEYKDEPIQQEIAAQPTTSANVQDVYVINVSARDGSYIYGRDLKHALRILGFRFGDMDIYHRYVEMDGTGDVLFSLINMIKPGTFEPSKMDRLMTPGVSLFMQLPQAGAGLAYFDLMLQAADKLANEVDGILLDAQRRPLSEHYLSQCRTQLKAYDEN